MHKRVSVIVLALGVILGGAGPAQAAGRPQDAILGDWRVASGDAIVHFTAHGKGKARRYVGRIAWLQKPDYGPSRGPALAGKPRTDRHNPDTELRKRTLLGLRLVWGLHYDPDDRHWIDGHVYNAEDGRTYHCEVSLKDPDHLVLRGYIGIPLLGGSTVWTRVDHLPSG